METHKKRGFDKQNMDFDKQNLSEDELSTGIPGLTWALHDKRLQP
jgi:hypothetical protein